MNINTTTKTNTKSLKLKNLFFGNWMKKLSKIGSALMFPIAVLPIAAILLRIGVEIPTDSTFGKFVQILLTKSGDIVFSNLYILFAVGVAFAFTKDKRGEAAFAGFLGIIILSAIMVELSDLYYGSLFSRSIESYATGFDSEKYKKEGIKEIVTIINLRTVSGFTSIFGKNTSAVLSNNVLNGIVVGSIVAWVYNRANNVSLPKVLGFFSGKRLIPALSIIVIIIFSIIWAAIFPWIGYVIYKISQAMSNSVSSLSDNKSNNTTYDLSVGARFTRAGIMGGYGFINRLLIPFGLHHIPNNIFWFSLGTFPSELDPSQTVSGDINIFLKGRAVGNPGGIFQAGFFPMMMFGLPALVGAFIFTAETKEQKIKVASLFGSAALVSFLTGITEPIEFAFLYVSPLLYLFHALLTGIFAFVTGAFGIQLGFGFSAGLLDYILSIPKSLRIINESGYSTLNTVLANPGWIFLIGATTAIAYFGIGVLSIKKLGLSTPGRKEGIIRSEEETTTTIATEITNPGLSEKAKKIVVGFGGWDNIIEYENCSTRLRYVVKDGSLVSEDVIKRAGAFGLVKVSDNSFQAIIGVEAESLNNQITSHKGEPLE
ncbi:PTS system glucose-specific IIC component/PTS system N-acetylglucosamine-specific IIC component [Mycoplasmopsis mustelae]|uniref:PTS system glucose-specific IIC component/PTS system N-acetylglucosamine-specific IIC component n=1 Tax=Mycoplasmopsis mustelae TaxID=171289 RepID=A0A4R7UDG3_9BACT|nr:PTS transporter subunit EIIC [Mycoplasmopsis mustelae]TDV22701.1 PTS system glucose-specific IIC component/PTS system N-acetylglucosamine-specific IIC component [Mycoplasmopsis mustelae]